MLKKVIAKERSGLKQFSDAGTWRGLRPIGADLDDEHPAPLGEYGVLKHGYSTPKHLRRRIYL